MSQALAVLTEDAGEDVGEVVGRLAELVRSRRDGVAPEPNSSGVLGLLRAVQSEPQRHALDQLLVLGTLLEGHADHVMDAVGPAVVPTVTTIRRRFNDSYRRKRKQPPLQRIVRALLGFDAKLSRYTRGKAFIGAVVVGRVGMARFNAIWSSPRNPAAANRNRQAATVDRQGAVAALKAAVAAFVSDHAAGDERWCVALSGGADSLALTAVAAASKPTTALIVDHRLQPDSGRVAATARDQAMSVGCVDAQVLCVDVGTTGGPEAAARTARYRALDDARGDAPVLLAHTLDDQAETVLLGLGRGSGSRSIAGMRLCDPPWYRHCLASVVRSPTPHASSWGSRRGRTRTTRIAGSPARGCAPRCCRCSRRCWAAASPKRWPAPRPHYAKTPRRSTNWPGRRSPTSATGGRLDTCPAGGTAGGGPAQGDSWLAPSQQRHG